MKLSSWRGAISLRNMSLLCVHRIPAAHPTAPRIVIKGRGLPHLHVVAYRRMVALSELDCLKRVCKVKYQLLPKRSPCQNLLNKLRKLLSGHLLKEPTLC